MHGCSKIVGLVMLATMVGCTSVPYRVGSADIYRTSPELEDMTALQIERGKPRPVIDGIGWVMGIPGKIILWDRRVENHNVSPETEAAIAKYLATNDLTTVKVRINQYAPLQEWDRLVANKSVGWGWRYTAGTLHWLEYTFIPGRLFGGDYFNPYTNSIYLYSDVPALAVLEGAHAKDVARRTWKGTYAVATHLPGGPLWYDSIATNDAMNYFHNETSLEQEQEAYRILYPNYGSTVGETIADFVPFGGDLILVAAVVPSHVIGRIKANHADANRPTQTAIKAGRLPYAEDEPPPPVPTPDATVTRPAYRQPPPVFDYDPPSDPSGSPPQEPRNLELLPPGGR